MEENRVRIADIARDLGLSTATVSNVIHGKTAKISDRTVRRVQEELEKREYIPSMAGILLAQNSSGIIGVVVVVIIAVAASFFLCGGKHNSPDVSSVDSIRVKHTKD